MVWLTGVMFMYKPAIVTSLLDGQHEQNPRVMDTIFIIDCKQCDMVIHTMAVY